MVSRLPSKSSIPVAVPQPSLPAAVVVPSTVGSGSSSGMRPGSSESFGLVPLSERSLDPSSSVVVVSVDSVSVDSVVVVSVVGVDVVVSVVEVAGASVVVVGVLVTIGAIVPEPDDLEPPRGLLAAVGVAAGVVLEAIGIAARASAAASSCASGRQSVAA